MKSSEQGRLEKFGRLEYRRRDCRERPIITHSAYVRIRFEVVIMPPQLQIRFPEARSIINLKQPPACDRNGCNDQELSAIGDQQRLAFHLEHKRVDKQDV